MKIQLVDKNQLMIDEWNKAFIECDDIFIHCGDFFSLETECVVSPANSFCFMDGSLDYIITKKLGPQVQEKLQAILKNSLMGELLVGQALLVKTNNIDIPYCISAPTMRVPTILNEGNVNIYLAAKAIFSILLQNEHLFDTVTISGLGTGVGKVPYNICAKQMRQAYDEVWLSKKFFPATWRQAQVEHQLLYTNNINDLQHEK